MGAKINYKGRQFGSWTVLECAGKKDYETSYFWKCRCICGTIKILSMNPLRRGRSKSCGCALVKHKLNPCNNDSKMNL